MPRGVYKRTRPPIRSRRTEESKAKTRASMLGKNRGPLTAEHRTNIGRGVSKVVIRTPRNVCRCGKICRKIGAKSCSPTCAYSDPEFIEKCRKSEEERAHLSRKVKESWENPDIRAARIAGLGLQLATTASGHNFPIGIPQSQLDFVSILCPAGYLLNSIRIHYGGGQGHCYTLDFGHPEAKVDIEIDGSSHRNKKDKDNKRDDFLKALGWKVIRIKV